MLARHLVHRAQHRLVADAALAQRQHELHALFAFVGRHSFLLLLISRETSPRAWSGTARRSDRAAAASPRCGCRRAPRDRCRRRPVGRTPRAKAIQKYGLPRPSWRASMCSSCWSRLPCVATAMPFTAPGGQSGKLMLTSTSRGMPCFEHAADDVGRMLDRGLPVRLLLASPTCSACDSANDGMPSTRAFYRARRPCRNTARPRRRCGRD